MMRKIISIFERLTTQGLDGSHQVDYQHKNQPPRVFGYWLLYDTNFAPHVSPTGTLTLATCKEKIRADYQKGDYVIGFDPKRKGAISFIATFDEVLTFDQYYRDPRFEENKPVYSKGEAIIHNETGDNIYRKNQTSNKWENAFSEAIHDQLSKQNRDLEGPVLVSYPGNFCYFGAYKGSENEVPSTLQPMLDGLHADQIEDDLFDSGYSKTIFTPELLTIWRDHFVSDDPELLEHVESFMSKLENNIYGDERDPLNHVNADQFNRMHDCKPVPEG